MNTLPQIVKTWNRRISVTLQPLAFSFVVQTGIKPNDNSYIHPPAARGEDPLLPPQSASLLTAGLGRRSARRDCSAPWWQRPWRHSAPDGPKGGGAPSWRMREYFSSHTPISNSGSGGSGKERQFSLKSRPSCCRRHTETRKLKKAHLQELRNNPSLFSPEAINKFLMILTCVCFSAFVISKERYLS